MTNRERRAHFGVPDNVKTPRMPNWIVRHHCAGGNAILDAKELFGQIADRSEGEAHRIALMAKNRLGDIADELYRAAIANAED